MSNIFRVTSDADASRYVIKRKTSSIALQSFIIIFFAFVLSCSPMRIQKAHGFWGEFVQEQYHFTLKNIEDKITGTILSALKQEAMKTINNKLNTLIGGSSTGSAKFITNWQDYLVTQPKNQANSYINDYISTTLSGKGSSSYVGNTNSNSYSYNKVPGVQYASEGFFVRTAYADSSSQTGSSSSSSYYSQLQTLAKSLTSEKEQTKVTYEGDPSDMFKKNNFKNLETYFSGINNPWSYSLHITTEYEQKKEEKKTVAETKAVAYQGFKGTGENTNGEGTIKTPGSLTKDALANAQDIGNKILAAATHPEEIISSVVSQLISEAIENGIGNVGKAIDKEVDSLNNTLNNSINNQINKYGPGYQYNNISNYRTNSSQ